MYPNLTNKLKFREGQSLQILACRRTFARFCLGLALVGGSASSVWAQYQGPYQPPVLQRPTMQTQGTTPSSGTTYNINTSNGGGGFGGYGGNGWGGYYPGLVGGALQGVASVTNANGQYLQQTQQARILNNAANTGQLDYRQRLLEQWRYEQSLKPTPEDIKQQEMTLALRRARNDPPNTEIWSGVALNTLYNNIKKAQLSGMRGPLVPVDPSVLRHVNLTSGTTGGSVGMLKNGGDLEWPLPLRSASYGKDKEEIDKFARLAYSQASAGQLTPETINGLSEAVTVLTNKIDADTPNMSMNQAIQASRFLNQLRSTVQALQDPNVSRLFNGQWSAQGDNVATLVDNLTQKGLSFAPAAPGSETYYTSLYNNFLSYDMGLSTLAAASRSQVQTNGNNGQR